tara:strand:+ start:2055 stop:2726 length:672 start_codon:yes stop_codon:yes gene_type:complete
MKERTETLTHASAPTFSHEGSYVDWAAILAGAAVATSIAFVFTTFGAALGLSFASPYAGEGSAFAAALAVGLWMLWTTISSFMAGGYITGRMRRRIDQASGDEVHVRDGIHGLTVWAVAVLIGAVLLGSGADTVVNAAADMSATVGLAVDNAAMTTQEAADVIATNEAELKAAAEAARKAAIVSAFLLAASLLVAGAGAYWAAGMGGQHRDEGRAFGRFGRWA